MTTAVTLAAVSVAVAAVACAIYLRRQLEAMRIEYQSEQLWADEYCREAEQARMELAALRKEHTALQMAYQRGLIPMQVAAWRSGLSKDQK